LKYIFEKYFLEHKIYILENIFQNVFPEIIFQNLNLYFEKYFLKNIF